MSIEVEALSQIGLSPGVDYAAICNDAGLITLDWLVPPTKTDAEIQQAIANYTPPTPPDWESALVAIHTGLASASPTCPFCQIRLWADADLTLDARVRDFTQAFLQPPIVKAGAVQSGLDRVWAALDATQQASLNTTDLAAWNDAHNLGLSLPWS